MKLLINLFLILILNAHISFAKDLPFICFSDITSGPSTGNTDVSKDEGGAIVTIYGRNFGLPNDNNYISIGGIKTKHYSWGKADKPANLSGKMKMDKISFIIPKSCPEGINPIILKTQDGFSNEIFFNVRPGNIYFISLTGNDESGDGSFQKPWATLDNLNYNGALSKIKAGDIVYVMDGVKHEVLAGDRACIDMGDPANDIFPKAIIGYPNAQAYIGNKDIDKSYSLWVSGFGPTIHFTIANMNLIAKYEAASMYHGFRLVGNKITAPLGTGPTGAIAGQGNDLVLLGNEITEVGFEGCSKLYHPIYIQSAEACSGDRLPTERNRVIAYNYLHDNFSYDGINIYRECGSSAYMTGHYIYNNLLENQTGCGIRVGDYVVGENHVFNNVLINCGIGPDPKDAEAMHVPLYVHAGWEDTTTTIRVYNNTIIGGGWEGGAAWSSSMFGLGYNHEFGIDFRNNIILSTNENIAYYNSRFDPPLNGVVRNIWFGYADTPSWDANPISEDALIINEDYIGLKENSPAIDKAFSGETGNGLPLPTHDFYNVERPQGPGVDIGAIEWEKEATTNVKDTSPDDSFVNISVNNKKLYFTSHNVCHYIICDIKGQQLSRGNSNYGLNEISLETFLTGIYFIRINGVSKRFVVID